MKWNVRNADAYGEEPRIEAFLRGVGGSPWLATVTEYPQRNKTIQNVPNQLVGVWYDNTPTPGLIDEAIRAAKHFHSTGRTAQFFLLSAHGHNMGGFGTVYCSMRTFLAHVGGGPSTPVATYLGYMPDAGRACGANAVNRGRSGRLDGITLFAGSQLAGFQTDAHAAAWSHSSNGAEIADPCWKRLVDLRLPTGTFPVSSLWSNRQARCIPSSLAGG
ncbi:MAG TPA: hypothetical protein VNG31_02075 [Candidatus Baltobacteraceae bacterium]|nr:hypothetical protein [Candidatus Baltobacteraceae bacterium]